MGKRAFRVDVRRKVLGYGKYPDDIDERDFPDLTYASAVRSKYPRARVVRIDAEKARAMPGVLAVLTAADVPVNAVGHLLYDWDGKTTVKVADYAFNEKISSLHYEFGLGINAAFKEDWSLYAEAATRLGSKENIPWEFGCGLRFAF